MNSECKCGRPTRDAAYVCDTCGDELARALGDVTWLAEELETTITRQRGVDYRGVGGSSGGKKPSERPSPVQWGASEARGDLRALLVSWALFCEAEGVRNSSPYPGLPDDDLPALSGWLLWRVDGLTLNEIGSDAVEEITSAVAHCRRVIDVAPDKWYAGPCNQETEGVECGADLYALSAKGNVSCGVCSASYDVAERRKWLLEAAEDRLADAATLARSVSWLGALPLNAARIRKWAERGRIVAKGHHGQKPLYRIGDAIDLLAKEAS
ncbi:hypothetical protein FB382_004376 [Nocardioides ginsengisegetis]|uniref:Helix-turn-helix domain-containing protein n=1 Tax=Nocardioides ginsengisegetis TaxID=661491 RepID=A0A7W3PBN0_9ACTN|nr:hypothetical protein [Nocardioides ginsengisegetis]MBA8805601.1 hypothetical protein [Nocardioides ginsengisegetis]MBA8806025.1 hypothetical protein [Nocardioides ginsengisegetis]